MAKKNGSSCSYLHCNSHSATNKDLSFFRFPTKDDDRCLTWIINSGRDEFSELNENQLRARYLCAKHFKDCAFTNSSRKRLLLNNPLAVPIHYCDDNSNQEIIECINPMINNHENFASGTDLNDKKINSSHNESFIEFINDFQPLPDILVEKNPNSEGRNGNNLSPTPRKRKLMATVSKQKMMLKRSMNKISFIRKKKLNQNDSIDPPTLLKGLENCLTGDPLTFVKMQIRHQKRLKWNEEEKNLCLSLYYKSPSLYKFLLDRGFKLPCIRLLQYWVNVHNIQPGFTNEVFDKLKLKASSMSTDEKECVLMFDEMNIKKALEYNTKLDIIEGFQDLGPLGRCDKLATHALVFMIRGLKHSWKCPVAYVISNNSIKASSLVLLLDMVIEKIIGASFSLKVIVSDLGSTNAGALKILGVTKENPFYLFGNEKIYCLFDFPHLLKCIRNNLLKHDLIVNDEIVSWSAVREFYETDKLSTSDCRAAPKLSERHIYPQPFHKMSVKLAAQVFSASVSRGMKAAHHLGLLRHPACISTATFLGKVNDVVDCMNSKNMADKNPLKRPLKKSNCQVIHCLKEAIPYIETWSVSGIKQPPCLDGMKQTIQGVLSLYKECFIDENSFLLTGRLNQDPLENLFGVLRRRCGNNCNPSAKEFRRNLQHSLSIRLMDPPSSSNCEPDGDDTLSIDGNIIQDHSTTASANKQPIMDNNSSNCFSTESMSVNGDAFELEAANTLASITLSNDKVTNVDISPLEDNVICYVAGWVGKKCLDKYSCTKCSTDLLLTATTFDLNREQLLLIKSFTKHDGELAHLSTPTDILYNIVKIQILAFSRWFPLVCCSKEIGEKLVHYLYKETEKIHPVWWSSDCKPHRLYMLQLLVKCKLFNCLKWKTNDLRDQALLKKREIDGGKINNKLKKLKNL